LIASHKQPLRTGRNWSQQLLTDFGQWFVVANPTATINKPDNINGTIANLPQDKNNKVPNAEILNPQEFYIHND
jgi:hypothetical protein